MLELTLTGLCLAYDFRAVVLTGPCAEEAAHRSTWTVAAQGEVKLHLGVALFDRPFVYTPTHLITERQQALNGEDVFDWLVEGCYRMPRSEVFGIDAHGREAQVFARDIDIEESPIAVFGAGMWVVAVVEIDPTLGKQVLQIDRPELADRFRAALKCYRAGPAISWEQALKQWSGAH
jgi:hypothetical protein